jgi:Tfp pilus assembly protein PilF
MGNSVIASNRFVPLISRILAIGLTTVSIQVSSGSIASAQFGGTQDMMLEKQRRQMQQAIGSQQPNQSRPPVNNPGHSHRPQVNNNIHIQAPGHFYPVNPYGFDPYYGGYGYGVYGNHYGNPFRPGPIIYPPRVTVVPHGVPLSSDLLNGTYGATLNPYGLPYNQYAAPPVTLPGPLAPAATAVPLVPPARQPFPADMNNHENNANNNRNLPPAPQDEIPRRVAALKPSNEAGRLRSDELIADGDREFAAQEYRRAASKYREAIAKAPDYSPGHLRAGHAYIATGDYELAVTYLAMGLELARTVLRPGFSLEQLYKGNQIAKEQHAESLADAILRQPNDGGLLFLAGIVQHYDGRPLQARDYFRRAAEMPGRHQPYAAMFVPNAGEPNPDGEPAQVGE